MDEQRVPIEGYEGLYEISATGRVFSLSTNRYRVRKGDEYGYRWVKLSKKNFRTKELWEKAFGDVRGCQYRGQE
ncbi:NUMOD4 domain-containing protein [Paenibacillus sp. MMO-177]|uniref:NUMOD4 domain-containing protein n=1 Tax=Paenibacillus sp. MMO-177 TaxID=3081289 RepID=UPI003FA6EEAD